MPFYDFTDPTGQPHELYFSMKDAPPIGSTIERDGVKLTRVFSDLAGMAQAHNVCTNYPYTSMRHGAFMAGAKHDSQGRAIIESQRHEKKFMDIHDLARD